MLTWGTQLPTSVVEDGVVSLSSPIHLLLLLPILASHHAWDEQGHLAGVDNKEEAEWRSLIEAQETAQKMMKGTRVTTTES